MSPPASSPMTSRMNRVFVAPEAGPAARAGGDAACR
jgi:hypothetical protein